MKTSEIRTIKDQAYGDPKVSLELIGAAWMGYLAMRRYHLPLQKGPINANDVANMMILMKVMRLANPECPPESITDCIQDIQVYADISLECDGRVDSRTHNHAKGEG